MSDTADRFELFVEGRTPEAGEEAARALADELSSVPGVTTRPLNEVVQADGAKALDGNMLGVLMTLGGSGALLPVAINTVRDWLGRQPQPGSVRIRKGDLELEFTNTTPPKEVEALIARLAAQA